MWYPLWDQNQVATTSSTLAGTFGSQCKAQTRSGESSDSALAKSPSAKGTVVENPQPLSPSVNYDAVIEFLKNPGRVTSVEEVTATLDRIGELICSFCSLSL